MANRSKAVLEMMVISFTDAEELMDFATTWAIQDSQVVRWRLFQLRNNDYDDTLVNDQLDVILQRLAGVTEQSADIRKQEEVEESI